MDKLRLGVVGYCPPTRFNEEKAIEYLCDSFDKASSDFPSHEITVVAGITNVGVLKLAYAEAKRRGWRTAGIGCKKAYDFEWFPTDEEPIIVGENWGDESPAFVNSIDALVRIGGGKQSLKETAQIRERGKKVYEYDLPALD